MIDTSSMAFNLIGLRALIALTAALLGGLIAIGKNHVSHRMLCGLVSFAAGALLGVTVKHIIPETIELLGLNFAVISLVVGTLIFVGIGRYIYFLCPACAASATEHDGGYFRLGVLMMAAMCIHSTVDGLAISAGSAASHGNEAVSSVGLLILLAVSYHKVPEGMALVSVARLAGYNRAKAIVTTALVELTTALGAFIGLIFLRGGVNKLWLGITLGVVAGSFLYTVGFALLKEMYEHEKGSIILYVVLGFISMIVASMIFAHTGLALHEH